MEQEEEVQKFKSSLDACMKQMKESIMQDVTSITAHAKEASEKLRSTATELNALKRKCHRIELSNELMKKILLGNWNDQSVANHQGEDQGNENVGDSLTSSRTVCPGRDRSGSLMNKGYSIVDHLKNLITNEISGLSSASLVFRTDSPATKLMVTFSNALGIDYLENTLGLLIREVLHTHKRQKREKRLQAKDGTIKAKHKRWGFEINPALLKPGEKRSRNLRHLLHYCNLFLKAIFDSTPKLPRQVYFLFPSAIQESQHIFL